MGCCCSSCREPEIELSQQEHEAVQEQRNAERVRNGLPRVPDVPNITLKCCCCIKPPLELSQQEQDEIVAQREARNDPALQPQETQQRGIQPITPQQTQSISRQQTQQRAVQPMVPQSPRSSISSKPSDQPPPYDEGAPSQQATSSAAVDDSLPKTRIPYAIPLASFMNDEALLNTISKVHIANFSDYGITQEQFLTFYYELDKRLAHHDDGESAMLDNVMSILRENNSSNSTNEVLSRVENFVELSNNDLFHPARLHVQVLGNEDTKHKFISSPSQELDRTKTMTKLSEIEEKLAKLTYKLERDLPDASDEEEKDELQAEYEDKKRKLRSKANAVLAEYGRRTDAEMLGPYGAAGQEGPLWLLVSSV